MPYKRILLMASSLGKAVPAELNPEAVDFSANLIPSMHR